jgi:hypothetical protein
MRANRKTNGRRVKVAWGGISKFMVPPELLVMSELRRMEALERQCQAQFLHLPHLLD